MISSPIDEIKSRLNIVDVIQGYIRLQKAGANYRAVCPFHSEKTPSFFVSPARQIWHCFGSCSEGGDIFKFVMKIEGVEFGDALRILAQKAGVELKKQDPKIRTERNRMYDVCEQANLFFETYLEKSIAGKKAKEYLLSRGIKEETIKKWRLGYAPDSWQALTDFLINRGFTKEESEKAGLVLKSEKGSYFDRFRNRIMFPVFNLNSQIIGFGGRVIEKKEGEAKYVNTPATILYDKSRVLYGLNNAGLEIRKKDSCVLVEGYTDVILAHQAGIENVVSVSGTALTSFQLEIIKRYSDNLLACFDMDPAGDSATKRSIEMAQTAGFDVKIVSLPEEKDPADVILEDASLFSKCLEKAKSIHDFYFDSVLSKFDKKTLEGKKAISKTILPIIRRIPNKIEQSLWVKTLSRILEVKEGDISEELNKIKTDIIEQESIDRIVLKPKAKKDILEEFILSLSIKYPKCLDLLVKEDLMVFSPQFISIVGLLKNNAKEYPAEFADTMNYLLLKSEVMAIDQGVDIEKEFKMCLKQAKTIEVRFKLDQISKELKIAEEQKDFKKIQELIQDFSLHSKLWGELETA